MNIVIFSAMIGLLALIIGFFLLFAPSVLRKINEFTARMVTKIDTAAFAYRVGIGISLLIAAAFMFFMAYYFHKRY